MPVTFGLWLTAVWAAAMTTIAIPELLPVSIGDESRRAIGVASGWVTMMLIGWPQMKEWGSKRVVRAGFALYAITISLLGCAVYGVVMLGS